MNRNRVIGVVSALAALSLAFAGEDWPGWRGPGRDGSIASFRLATRWADPPTRIWRSEVGAGHSSPVVAGGRAYLHTRQGEDEVVGCYDLADGKRIWADRYPAPYTMHPAATGHGKGPKSTPAAGGGRLFTFGISGILSAYDLDSGRLLWRKEFAGEFPKTSPDFGTAMSPLLDGALLVAHVGGSDNGALTAFDPASGKVHWTWRGDGPGYASPIAVDLGGTRQIVTQTQKRIVGVSAAAGELLWSIPFETQYVQNIVTPVAYRGLLIFSGIDKGVFALRPTRGAGAWTTEKVWETREASFYMSSPVVFGDLLVGFSHRNSGQFVVLDPGTGTKLWAGPGRQGDNASILHAGDVVFLLTNDGVLTVARGSAQGLETLRRTTLATSPVWAHPVVATTVGTRILVKDAASLALWSLE